MLTGLTYRQVDYLDRKGTIRPTIAATGSGSQRGYTINDVVTLAVWKELRNGLVSLSGNLAPDVEESLLEAAREGADRSTIAAGPYALLVVDIERIREDIVARLPRLRTATRTPRL